ncbi:MAG: phage portal protein [Oscillospiraceae bacterium]
MRNTGIFDIFKKKSEPKSMVYAKMLDGRTPVFSQFGTDIYASDVVQQAVSCIVHEILKLRPAHVRQTNGVDSSVIEGNIQNVLDRPNPLMTTADFLEKITWILFLNYNCFILPTWEGNTLTGLYPLNPVNVDFLEDAAGRLFINFKFRNGYESGAVRADDVIHIRKNYSVNDYMGGNASGQPDNAALLKTLELNSTLLQGVGKALKSSFAVNGIVKYNTVMDDGVTEKNIKLMEERLMRSDSGLLPLDMKAEYIPLDRNIEIVDPETLKFVDEKILRYFGVPLCILTGDYTKEQYEAFYQKTLEPLVIKLSQAFTKGIFTNRAALGFGNKIVFFAEELVFMTMSQKLDFAHIMGDRGAVYDNELRVMFGMKPLKELEGVRKMSLNYIDAGIVNQYQLSRLNQYQEDKPLEEEDEVNKDES